MPSLHLLSLLIFSLLTVHSTTAECKACKFDGNDPADCVIYGKLGDEIVEWSTAGTECKGYYDIKITGINPSTSCSTVNAFVNSMRFGDLQSSTSKLGLGVASEGGAFFVDNTDANRVDMADTITINGETTNCEASANNCWTAMKAYFAEGDGAKEMGQVCDKLYNQVRVDRNLEESVLRNRLCMEHKEGNQIIISCDPLAQQVKDQIAANPDRDCSGYGFETPLSTVAGCENAVDSSKGTGSTTSSAGREWKHMTKVACAAFYVVVVSLVGLV